MGERSYEYTLSCGCAISLDKAGGLIPCHYGYGCGKKGCDEKKQCKKCLEQEEKCGKAWAKYRKSKEYKEHQKEIKKRNQ